MGRARRAAAAAALLWCACGFAATGAAAPMHGDGGAPHLWWTAQAGHELGWTEPGNWLRHPGATATLPVAGEATYVTTTDEFGPVPHARIDAGDFAESGELYIAGWPESFDDMIGIGVGRRGQLSIYGGELHATGNYVRVGMRGSDGAISQAGGLLVGEVNIDLGWLGFDSVGRYQLKNGTIDARLNVGTQGTGLFEMSGGEVVPRCCSSSVGRGYETSENGYLPGVGLMLQSGGRYRTTFLSIGMEPGSTGVIEVKGAEYDDARDTGTLLESGSGIIVGRRGAGAVYQSGGTVRLARDLVLGGSFASSGQYVMMGGLLDTRRNLEVGAEGSGHLMVIGARGRIRVAGDFAQAAGSLWTVHLAGEGEPTRPIEVTGSARLASGARLRIQRANGFLPERGASFEILRAAGGISDAGIELAGVGAADWSVERSGASLYAVFVGGDSDGDGLSDGTDNCPSVPNPDQRDTSGNGWGNACDGDVNRDGYVGLPDLTLVFTAYNSGVGEPGYLPEADCNGDGWVGFLDYQCVARHYGETR